MINNMQIQKWDTNAFKELFPKYNQIKSLFKLRDSTLQHSILSLGDCDFYSVYIYGGTFDKQISSNSLGFQTLIRSLLIRRFRFLQNYDVNIYDLDEFYVSIPKTELSLYIPFKAFLNKDVDSILERTKSYYISYYEFTNSGKDKIKALNKALKSKEVKQFCSQLNSKK